MAARAYAAVVLLAVGVCTAASPARGEAPDGRAAAFAAPPAKAELGRARSLSFGSYVTPKGDFVADDGGVDVVFHFHDAEHAEPYFRAAGLPAAVVLAHYGAYSSAYYDALASPIRFDEMLSELTVALRAQLGRDDAHVRRLALVAYSAGYAAVSRILAVPRHYARVDTLILLDSLHASFSDSGSPRVDMSALEPFTRFARDAAEAKKLLVLTYSSIVPPDYASTAETAAAVFDAVGVPRTPVNQRMPDGTILRARADQADLHLRGFFGGSPKDHADQLGKLEEILRTFLAPRWRASP